MPRGFPLQTFDVGMKEGRSKRKHAAIKLILENTSDECSVNWIQVTGFY